jgi:Tol biopolymer transport system component
VGLRGGSPELVGIDLPGIPWGVTPDGRIVMTVMDQLIRTWRFPIPIDTASEAKVVDQVRDMLGPVSLSPDGEVLARAEWATRTSATELVLQSTNGTNRKRLATIQGMFLDLRWSPDGTRIAGHAAGQGQGGRWLVVDVRDGSVIPLGAEPVATSLGVSLSGFPPAWSPDGRTLYAPDLDSLPRPQVRRYQLVAGDTGILVSAVWARREDCLPQGIAVSPDGKTLAVGGASIYLVPLDGRPAREIVPTDGITQVVPLVWGDDGRIIYVTRDSRGLSFGMKGVFVVPAAGGRPRQVGVLPAPCDLNISVLRGGHEAGCFELEQGSDIWLGGTGRR